MSDYKPAFHIRSYPGTNVTFNLSKLERMKKANENIVSDLWENDFVDSEPDIAALPVFVRLMYDNSNSRSWIVAYRGSQTILRAPLYLEADTPEDSTVSIRLRDFSNIIGAEKVNEDEQCLRRVFKFTFLERFEAVAFQVCHNIFVHQKPPVCPIIKVNENEDKDSNESNGSNDDSADSNDSDSDDSNNKSADLLDTTMKSTTAEERRRALFETGDQYTVFDDAFENTQKEAFDY